MNCSLQILSNSIRTGFAVIGLLATTALPMSARCPDSQGNRGLEGHWVITILTPGGDRFTNLLTFTQDGGVEIFASYKQTQSIGRGTYCRTGNNREFTLTFVQLGYKTTLVPNELVPIPIQNELATVHSTILLSPLGDAFTGPNNVEIVNPLTGQVLFAGNGGSVVGKLVKPDVQ
jgi:hypothetical protein